MTDDVALQTRGLSKSYGAHRALAGVDLTVRRGEIHGLLGANGAGKTTLLRLLLGLVARDAGSITRLGGLGAADRREGVAGFVDAPRFHPFLSGRENLRLLAMLDGESLRAPNADRIDEALERVGLTRDADARVFGYSAGMKQRLGLASSLLRSPRLLLLDEPTSSLDPQGARDIRACVRRLAEEGAAVLLSSHDMREVEDLCSHITIIDRGRVLFSGTIEALKKRAPEPVFVLETSDDEAARALAAAHADVEISLDEEGEALVVRAPEPAMDRFVIALGAASIAVRTLVRRAATLEALFLTLTGSEEKVGPTDDAAPAAPSDPPPRSEPLTKSLRGAAIVARVELSKISAQKFVWATLAACVAAPFAFVAALKLQSSLPEDTLFGRFANASGFAVPLVVLGFASAWALPVLMSVVSGDRFSSEDRHGTWPTLLVRSRTRGEIFFGKTVAALLFSIAALLATMIASVAAGALFVGTQPLVSLSGTELEPRHAFTLVVFAWLSALPPSLAVSALALLVSVTSRSTAAGIGAPVLSLFAMQLLSFVNGPDSLRRAMLSAPFGAWHGLLADPPFHGPVVEGAVVSALYFIVAIAIAARTFTRRDIGG